MKALQFPLTRITIGFVLGILYPYFLKPSPNLVFLLLFISFIIFGISFFVSKKRTRNSTHFGLTVYILAFFIGACTQIVHTDSFQKSNYTHYEGIFEKPQLVLVTLREKLRSSNYNDRYVAIVNAVNQSEQSGRILLNIRKDSLNRKFEIGNQLLIKGILYKNSPPANPNQFDYSKYLENKQIYAQLYSESEDIKISTVIEKNIWYYTSKLRTKILDNLEKNNFHKAELNVAAALILGQQQDISPDIIRDYQYAGAVHILSVSGLHIGFILFFVTTLLKPFPNTKRGSLIKLVIILISLSLFGVLAGLAPSVIRSVTMFSFVAIGMYLRRSTNIYHTLLVSILLILLFQPSFLFDVGFQLSYTALFFILWLQPLLSSIWTPKNKIATYFWDILTVSFAAQIGAFPISIYYFHQFPGLFFITNVVIIPFLSLIMALGVLVMILASFNYVPAIPAKFLEWSISILDRIINSIASLEQFVIQDIPFNLYLLASIFLLIISLIIWFEKPNFSKTAIVLSTLILFQISYFETHRNIEKQQEWVVFNTKKNTLIVERHGKEVTLFATDSLLKMDRKNRVLNSYLTANFSSLKTKRKLKNLLFFNGNKILILDSLGIYPKNTNPDILVLTQSSKINLDRLFQIIKPKMVVADASNYKSIQKQWKISCAKQKIPFHATGEKGFYRLN